MSPEFTDTFNHSCSRHLFVIPRSQLRKHRIGGDPAQGHLPWGTLSPSQCESKSSASPKVHGQRLVLLVPVEGGYCVTEQGMREWSSYTFQILHFGILIEGCSWFLVILTKSMYLFPSEPTKAPTLAFNAKPNNMDTLKGEERTNGPTLSQ